MCLILFAWRAHPKYRLVVAANRDEYFGRPTAPADFWTDHPHILAGRDLEAGGTWLGITTEGRFAALTNYRNPADRTPVAPSRGRLVSDFLAGTARPEAYLAGIAAQAQEYNGFSLLAGDAQSLCFLSNRGGGTGIVQVEPGVHGLSNHLLDTPWPKVERGKAGLAALLDAPFGAEAALDLLDDTRPAASGLLPQTGVSPELEERLSSLRIAASGGYGTRSSTVLCVHESGEIEFTERSFRESGEASGTLSYRFASARPGSRGEASSRRAGSPPRKTPLPAR